MAREVFHHDTIKKIIGAFATILDEVRFTNGHGEVQPVPLLYSPREKFTEDIRAKPDAEVYAYDITLPRIGYQVEGFNFAPDRHTNPMGIMRDDRGNFTYNRVPYDFNVSVFIAAQRMNDGNRIIEQIIPFFTPEFTITVRDIQEIDLKTNMSITLDSVSTQVEYEGTMDNARVLSWTLQFTVRAYLYQNIRNSERIKKTIIDMRDEDFDKIYERLVSEVEPRSAGQNDPHTIKDTIERPEEEDE